MTGGAKCDPADCRCFDGFGDPDWLAAHADLRMLHADKSASYGTADDRLANFTSLAEQTGDAPERYVLERIIEKAGRALNIIAAGDPYLVAEYPDIASLALCAEALRRRHASKVIPITRCCA